MKLAVTGPLPTPAHVFVPAATVARATNAPARWEPTPAPAPQRLDETIRGGLTWAAISALIGIPGRV